MDQREKLISYSVHYNGDWARIAEAIKNAGPGMPVVCKETTVTIYDRAYPSCLRALRHPPWVLYARGDLALLQRPAVTIIGSREMNAYGRRATITVARRLARDLTIVSGVAKGVDAMAQTSALAIGGGSIGVIGNGFDTVYPKENQKLYARLSRQGLLLSEYPPHVGVRKEHFPWRNRLLAALGSALVVTQAACKSGTMLTVNQALALGKDIYCVPQPFGDEEGKGCNLLISQGAEILYTDEQLNEICHTCKSEAVSLS